MQTKLMNAIDTYAQALGRVVQAEESGDSDEKIASLHEAKRQARDAVQAMLVAAALPWPRAEVDDLLERLVSSHISSFIAGERGSNKPEAREFVKSALVEAAGFIRAVLHPLHPADGVPAQGGTPGPWRVRKRTNDVGEVLDCFVTAPDCQGRAYDAHILGDDYDSIDLKLADAELVVAAVNAFRATATHPTQQGLDALNQAIEAMQLALSSHGIQLLSYPPQDAWAYRRVDEKLRTAISALAAQAKQEGGKP